MAQAENKLANGASHIDFQTSPDKYRHWKLAVDGDPGPGTRAAYLDALRRA